MTIVIVPRGTLSYDYTIWQFGELCGSMLLCNYDNEQGDNMTTINGYDFRTELAKLIPNYSMDVDNEGQVIIYTNLKETAKDNYKEMN